MGVLVSGFKRFFRLSDYLHRYTRDPIYISLGAPSLPHLFDEEFYSGLPGGMMEGFGRLFSYDLRLLVFPVVSESGKFLDPASNGTDVDVVRNSLKPTEKPLFDYLLARGLIELLDRKFVYSLPMRFSRDVRDIFSIKGDWEKYVPSQVAP